MGQQEHPKEQWHLNENGVWEADPVIWGDDTQTTNITPPTLTMQGQYTGIGVLPPSPTGGPTPPPRRRLLLIALGLLLVAFIPLALIAQSIFSSGQTPIARVATATPLPTATVLPTVTLAPTIAPTATTGKHPATPIPTTAAGSGGASMFQLALDDEFNGTQLNTTYWQTYWGHPGGNVGSFWNATACEVTNGTLVLHVVAKPQDGAPFTSCGISAAKYNVQTYGKYEFRARIDAGHSWGGVGLLWPKANHWPPEIDDCEYGTDSRNDCVVSLHYDADNKWQGTHVSGDYTQWHTYTIIWLPNSLQFLIDGTTIFTTTKSVPAEPMWFAVQTEANSDAKNLGAYYVDWVHIYKYVG